MFTLTINSADLCFGRRANATECPVVLAMRRLVKPGVLILVFNKRITLRDRRTLKLISEHEMNEKLKTFISQFDNGKKIVLKGAEVLTFRIRGTLPKENR